jgi:uncharacterized protein YjiS (DUF1127 family)
MSTTTSGLHIPAIAMPSFRAPLATLHTWLQRARKRAHDRAAMALLSDRELRDFNADRWTIGQELSKPFWRG